MTTITNYAPPPSRARVAAAAPTLGAELPLRGAWPAGDLRCRVGEEALRRFYCVAGTGRWYELRRGAAVVACCGLCWAAVFGAGGLIFG